jgi:hypothetical protein
MAATFSVMAKVHLFAGPLRRYPLADLDLWAVRPEAECIHPKKQIDELEQPFAGEKKSRCWGRFPARHARKQTANNTLAEPVGAFGLTLVGVGWDPLVSVAWRLWRSWELVRKRL